jgi:hypothetical protein
MWCWSPPWLDYLVTFILDCWVLGESSVFVGDKDLKHLAACLVYRLRRWSRCTWLGVWRCEVARLPTTITICFRNGGFRLHKVSIQTIPNLLSFVLGVTSLFALDCWDVVLLKEISGHPEVGVWSSYAFYAMIPLYTFLFNCNNAVESKMVGVLRPPFALELELRCYDSHGFDNCFWASFHPKPNVLRAWPNLELSMVRASVKWPWLKWDMKARKVLIQLRQIQLTSRWVNLHKRFIRGYNGFSMK